MATQLPAHIVFDSDQKDEAQWVNKAGLMKRIEGLNINTLNVWLMEMRNDNKFDQFVINPTHKLVWINVEGFINFLRWKAHQRGY